MFYVTFTDMYYQTNFEILAVKYEFIFSIQMYMKSYEISIHKSENN